MRPSKSVPGSAPPTAASASATRVPSGSRIRPGCVTRPSTLTTTSWGGPVSGGVEEDLAAAVVTRGNAGAGSGTGRSRHTPNAAITAASAATSDRMRAAGRPASHRASRSGAGTHHRTSRPANDVAGKSRSPGARAWGGGSCGDSTAASDPSGSGTDPGIPRNATSRAWTCWGSLASMDGKLGNKVTW